MKEEEPMGVDPQDELAARVAYLIAGYIKKKLTRQEHQELDDWVCASMDNQRLFEKMTDKKYQDYWKKWRENLPTAQRMERLKSRLEFSPPEKKPFMRTLWPHAIAASILLAALVSYKWMNRTKTIDIEKLGVASSKDMAPGGNRASLTLSDGKVILLDSARNGPLATEADVSVTKKDSGQISYQVTSTDVPITKEEFNILNTPPAGQFKLVLPDGTRVWLNASSSLKYPTSFHGTRRMVELTGEGYFEVAKDPGHPFEVSANGVRVEVLGTHLNINAYTNEPDLKVTLVEGTVKVNGTVVLKPGEEAAIDHEKNMSKSLADLETALAWKDGMFLFKQAPLDALMRQVARWYDCEASFQEPILEHFNASIPRNVPVSKLLHFLEGTGRVHFTIEDKKIIVMK